MNQILDEKQIAPNFLFISVRNTQPVTSITQQCDQKLRKLDGSRILLTFSYFIQDYNKRKTSMKSRHFEWAIMNEND